MEQYIVKFRFRNMEKCGSITYNSNLDVYKPAFKVQVSYKIYDPNGTMICHNRRKRIYCDYDNTQPRKGEINPLLGLEFEDLSEEVRKQILIEKIKELAIIDIKLFNSKWSSWEEISIEIDN